MSARLRLTGLMRAPFVRQRERPGCVVDSSLRLPRGRRPDAIQAKANRCGDPQRRPQSDEHACNCGDASRESERDKINSGFVKARNVARAQGDDGVKTPK